MEKLLDQNIVIDIIVRLPVKSILRFRCVSKAWYQLLKDPYFVRKHLSHAIEMNRFSVMMLCGGLNGGYYPDYTDTFTLSYDPSLSTLGNPVHINYPPSRNASLGIKVWGICNGLICLSPANGDGVVLWNPATKEFKKVPSVTIESVDANSKPQHAFGYDYVIDDFKVVSIMGIQNEYICEVQVYSLKFNSWRRLENVPHDLCPQPFYKDQVSVNGAIHWFALTNSEPHEVIASFNFKDDRLVTMHLPSFCDEYVRTYLCSLRGSLCIHGSIDGRTDVWEMKEYGVTESWAKLFTFNQDATPQFSRQLVPLQFVKNDEVLVGYETDVGYHLDSYDLNLGTSKNVKACAKQDSLYATTFAFVESLVMLNSDTYVGIPEIEDSKASAETIGRDGINSGAHVDGIERGDSEDYYDDSEEGEEEEEAGSAQEFPLRPKSVSGAMDTSPHKNCEVLDRYNCYIEEFINLKRRKLDLETRKLNLEIRAQENRHMSMDTSTMNVLQLQWWRMRANEIAEKPRITDMSIGGVNDGKEDDEDCNDLAQEEDINDKKKKEQIM